MKQEIESVEQLVEIMSKYHNPPVMVIGNNSFRTIHTSLNSQLIVVVEAGKKICYEETFQDRAQPGHRKS